MYKLSLVTEEQQRPEIDLDTASDRMRGVGAAIIFGAAII